MRNRIRTRSAFLLGVVSALALLTGLAAAALATRDAPATVAATAPPAILTELAVFAAPRVTSDRLPAQARSVLADIAADGNALGGANAIGVVAWAKSRRLMGGTGGAGDFYAVPTEGGKVCYTISLGPAGCHDSFATGPLAWGEYDPDALGSGVPISVYGLARDDVVGVDVVVDGKRQRARLARNAFFYTLNDAAAHPTRLIARLRGGGEHAVVVPPPPSA
jgi:hypothetical protein